MKSFKTVLAVAFMMTIAYVLYQSTDVLIAFTADMTALLLFAARLCVGTVAFVIASVCVWWLRRQSNEHNRQRDGAFPLREYWLEPLPKRIINALLGRASARVLVDVNAMVSHGAVIYQGVHQLEPAAGWDRQLTYMQSVENTRRVQAITPGDAVLGNPLVNLQRGIAGVANTPTGKLVAGAWDKKPTDKQPKTITVQPEPVDTPALPAPKLTPQDAVAASKPTQLVMGQTSKGELVYWNMLQTPHLRFHGMTQGSGKTNAIQMVAASALRTGSHVVVLDRVGFKDWGEFEQCAEFIDTANPYQLADAMARLYNIYLGRVERLKKAGVKNVATMPKPVQRIIVVISEFGAQMATARADGVYKDVEYPLTQIARLAAATGIHLVAEDQAVKGWARELTANMTPVIGRMPTHAGQACGYQGRGGGTDTFAPYTFWCDGVMFQTPHAQPHLDDLLAHVQPPTQLVMLTPAANVTVEDRSTVPVVPAVPVVPQGVGVGVLQEQTPPTTGTFQVEQNGGTTGTAQQEDDPGRWEPVVAAWAVCVNKSETGNGGI